MLRLPSLDMVFSSKSAECELDESNVNLDNIFNRSNNGTGKWNDGTGKWNDGAAKWNDGAGKCNDGTGKWNDDSPGDQDHSRGSLIDESSMSGGLSVTGNVYDKR